MEFFRQEYWSGLPFPSPGDLPNPGIEPGSAALQADSLPCEPKLRQVTLKKKRERKKSRFTTPLEQSEGPLGLSEGQTLGSSRPSTNVYEVRPKRRLNAEELMLSNCGF